MLPPQVHSISNMAEQFPNINGPLITKASQPWEEEEEEEEDDLSSFSHSLFILVLVFLELTL